MAPPAQLTPAARFDFVQTQRYARKILTDMMKKTQERTAQCNIEKQQELPEKPVLNNTMRALFDLYHQ